MSRQDSTTRKNEQRSADNAATRRYQPRSAGTGYGRSSGYAPMRQYTDAEQKNRNLFRFG